MKSILFIFLFFVPLPGSAQKLTLSGTAYNWAGGVCCRHGTNYSITVQTGHKQINSLEIIRLCFDGYAYSKHHALYQDKNSFSLGFEFVIDDKETNIEEVKRNLPETCSENILVFKLNGKKHSLVIENIQWLASEAYP